MTFSDSLSSERSDDDRVITVKDDYIVPPDKLTNIPPATSSEIVLHTVLIFASVRRPSLTGSHDLKTRKANTKWTTHGLHEVRRIEVGIVNH